MAPLLVDRYPPLACLTGQSGLTVGEGELSSELAMETAIMGEAKRRKQAGKYPKQTPSGELPSPWLGAVLMVNEKGEHMVLPFPHEPPRVPEHAMGMVIQECQALCRQKQKLYSPMALLEFCMLGFLATIRDDDPDDQVATGLMMVSQVTQFRYWFIVAASSDQITPIIIPVKATSFDEAESNIKAAMSLILDAPREALLQDIPKEVMAALAGMLEDGHVLVSA